MLDLYSTLASEGEGSEAASSALAALVQSISNSGYQLVVSSATPQPSKEQGVVSMSGNLPGAGGEDQAPTIVIVAHYDSAGAAPNLATGADSNGSGVSILLEMARLFSSLYSSSRSHPAYSLVFLLSGGGKINYAGTKRWLEEHLDMDTTSDLLANVDFVLCLDSLGKSSPLKLHVSKPPKEGSAGDVFLKNLNSVSKSLYGSPEVEMVHKKINLADDSLAWEHERFSIRRLPAFTLSTLPGPQSPARATILDTVETVPAAALEQHTRVIAEALACSLYPKLADGGCSGQLFAGSLSPSSDSLTGWLDLATAQPRHPSLLVGKNSGQCHNIVCLIFKKFIFSDVVKSLTAALSRYTHDVVKVVSTPDRREPEYVLYDTPSATLNVYRVKPAVFDLFLSSAIGCYLALVYLLINNSSVIIMFLTGLVKEKEVEMNGHSKSNGVKNGHKLHAY